MPKFRVKIPGQSTAKVDVSSSASFAELTHAVAKELRISPDFQLSLNKQTPLQANQDDSLAAAGICAGDLLWVLKSNPSPAATTPGPTDSSDQHDGSATARRCCNTISAKAEAAPDGSSKLAPLPQPSPNDVVMTDANVERDKDNIPADRTPGFKDILHKVVVRLGTSSDASCSLIAAVHAAMLNQHFRPNWLSQDADDDAIYSLPAADRGSGLAARLQYSLQAASAPQHPSPQCVISASRIGPFMIFAARDLTSSQSAIQLKFNADDWSFHQAASDDIQSDPASNSGSVAAHKALAGLHEKLEAELVLPLTRRCFAAAGQKMPAGLLGLRGPLAAQPAELLTQILGHLDAASLAITACTCSELKRVAYASHLWQRLYSQEFGSSEHLDSNFDYRAGFGESWKRREEERRVRQRRHPLYSQPPPIPGWFGPQVPGHFPMPPGITGGDYDRLPQPFLQGGPGMLGGPLRQGYRTQGQGNGRGFGSLGGFRMH